MACSCDFPAATQPGKSGNHAPNVALGPRSRTAGQSRFFIWPLRGFVLFHTPRCVESHTILTSSRTGRKGPMDRQGELRIIRAAYAKQILAATRIMDNARLEAAFSATRREDFLGPGPWWILRRFRDYVTTPNADPVYLYTDDLVGILPERHLNNGQPSLHAHLIHQASPAAGEHVVHIGTGTGYYTAILAHLVGPSGRVTGIEYEPELAARAKA